MTSSSTSAFPPHSTSTLTCSSSPSSVLSPPSSVLSPSSGSTSTSTFSLAQSVKSVDVSRSSFLVLGSSSEPSASICGSLPIRFVAFVPSWQPRPSAPLAVLGDLGGSFSDCRATGVRTLRAFVATPSVRSSWRTWRSWRFILRLPSHGCPNPSCLGVFVVKLRVRSGTLAYLAVLAVHSPIAEPRVSGPFVSWCLCGKTPRPVRNLAVLGDLGGSIPAPGRKLSDGQNRRGAGSMTGRHALNRYGKRSEKGGD
jgi:hypothetical protein